ncbi:MAG: LPS assembly protein LptD [Proteobacteria bacterium]|nr:LPS assembly protein LptD [Pseudomonadota bacterium]MBU1739463.1 LPS assembly protein LptD [Pseudomonadota bacterium]
MLNQPWPGWRILRLHARSVIYLKGFSQALHLEFTGIYSLPCRIGFRTTLSLVMLLFFLSAHRIGAQEMQAGAWTITSDRMISFDNPARTVADGNVLMEYFNTPNRDPVRISADSVTYFSAESLVEAKGKVTINDRDSKITASEARINLKDQTGSLKESAVTMAGQTLRFTGALVEKTGENTFRLTDGLITACAIKEGRSPDWSIRCSEATIEIDGMAYLKHSSLRAKKLPILYSPFMVLPAKVSRASGFLFPEISMSSRDGAGLVAPYFINLSPSSDMTLYPGYYSRRGALTGIDIRHVSDFHSLFSIGTSYLGDLTVDQGPPLSNDDYRKDGYLRTRKDRYWLRGMLDHEFSGKMALKIDLDSVSDQDFLHEFRETVNGFDKTNREMVTHFNRGFQEASLDFRESILHFSTRGEQTTGGMELRYTDNALADYNPSPPLQTLPRIMLKSRLPIASLPVTFGWDSEYLNYYQKEGFGYHRLDMTPRLILPIPLGRSVEGVVSAGLRETFYRIETYGDTGSASWNSERNNNRTGWEISANAAGVLSRDFRPDFASLELIRHTFRPNLKYNYLYTEDQSDLPDLDNTDRLQLINHATWQLNNYFLLSGLNSEGSSYSRNLGSIKLSQSFNIREARRASTGPEDKRRPLSDLLLDIEVYPLANLYLHYYTTLNVYGNGVTGYTLSSNYSNTRNDIFSIDYNYRKGSARDLTTTARTKLHRLLSASYSTTRSFLTDHKTNESLGLIYTPGCWDLEISVSENSEDRKVMATITLTGIGKAWEWDRSNL